MRPGWRSNPRVNERVSVGVLEAKPPAFSESDAGRLAREVFGIVATLHPLESERDQNFRLRADDGREYVLKIANPAEDPAVVDFQLQALRHVALRDPGLPVPRVCTTLDGACWRSVAGPDGSRHAVRMVTYLPGQRLADVPHGPRLLRALGEVVARLGRALRGFFHPAAGHELLWDLKHAARLRAHLADVEGADRRDLAERVLDRFEAKVLPVLPGLRAQVIHADANESNVLVDPGDRERIAGVVDFGDMVHSALVNDLAVAVASVIPGEPDPLAAAGTVVAGYHAVTPLAEEEIVLLVDLTATRLVASVLISAWRSKLHPENVAYIAASDASEWSTLERIDRTNRELAHAGFRGACGLAPPRRKPPDGAVEGLLERRSRLLGPALHLFYERPLHIVRREGVLIGLEGPLGNVLKIRPPMVFTEADADHLVETLDRVLAGRGGT